jgi:hypothetical protein
MLVALSGPTEKEMVASAETPKERNQRVKELNEGESERKKDRKRE